MLLPAPPPPPPSLQSNSSSSQQGDSGHCRSASCSSNLASSAMVAHPIESSSQQPCVTSTQSTPHADLSDSSKVHAMFPRLHLTVCRVSSSTIKQKASWTGYQTAPLSNSVFHSKGLRISMVLLESLVC